MAPSCTKKQLPVPSTSDLQEPQIEKEKAIILASHVLIFFPISGKVHVFLGPFPRFFAKPGKKYPCHHHCKPRAFKDTTYKLGFMISPLCLFRSSPTINNEAYINWLDMVDNKKEQI